MVTCKYDCGAEFPDTPQGQAEYMRHCNFDCPNNPKSKRNVPPDPTKTEMEKLPSDDEYLDEQEILNKIIAEATRTSKRPAIVRMVSRHIGDKNESIKTLAEALRIADIPPNQRNLILKNWAAHMDIPDVESILEKEKHDDEEKTAVDKIKEKKELKSATEEMMKKAVEDELRQLELLRLQRQRKMLEKELSEEPKEKESEQKIDFVVDGVQLKVTPQEMLAWKRYEADKKKDEEEREERRKRADEKAKRTEDELVEWVIGEGSNARTIKVRPETIPLLMQSQNKKGGENGELKLLREELKEQRNQFQQFQTAVLQRDIDELKVQLSVDPLDRMMQQKQKLENLGIVRSDKLTAQDQMYDMDRKKLDTMLNIVVDKSQSTSTKVDKLFDVFGPLAKDYVQNTVLQMKQQQGKGMGEEVKRTETETQEALEQLEQVEQAMVAPDNPVETNENISTEPKVVDIGKTKKTTSSKGAKK